jgi:hypothetical protein
VTYVVAGCCDLVLSGCGLNSLKFSLLRLTRAGLVVPVNVFRNISSCHVILRGCPYLLFLGLAIRRAGIVPAVPLQVAGIDCLLLRLLIVFWKTPSSYS